MSQDVDIEFVGCFDTVSSVGAIIPRVLPFSTHNGKTWVFRHALALDEYRVKFRQETWHYSLPEKTFSIQDWVLDKITLPVRFMSQWLASEEEREVAALLEEYKKIASGESHWMLHFYRLMDSHGMQKTNKKQVAP